MCTAVELTAVVGGTVIDGTGRAPVADAVVLIEGDRIRSVAPGAAVPASADVVDAHGKYVIPGLLDANVHLTCPLPDVLLQYDGRFTDIVIEAAQNTLRSGVTTVFDTWGHLPSLLEARDLINRGESVGSRIFAAGNIIGLDGPLSADFFPPGATFGPQTLDRINREWDQGVGRDLLWRTPEGIRERVRAYIESSGIDFVKYAASGHASHRQFVTFAEPAQRIIVEEAHRAGLTAQAHSTTVTSLAMSIAAGVDLVQHGNFTGPEPIPEDTLADIAGRPVPIAAIMPTQRYLSWLRSNGPELMKVVFDEVQEKNDRRLVDAGARLLLTTDGMTVGPMMRQHPSWSPFIAGAPDLYLDLGEAHFSWLEAAVERGMSPLEVLSSATRHVAAAYGLADDLGTVEPGKRADLVVLDADPLADVRNYRQIAEVVKDGVVVDRAALPTQVVLGD